MSSSAGPSGARQRAYRAGLIVWRKGWEHAMVWHTLWLFRTTTNQTSTTGRVHEKNFFFVLPDPRGHRPPDCLFDAAGGNTPSPRTHRGKRPGRAWDDVIIADVHASASANAALANSPSNMPGKAIVAGLLGSGRANYHTDNDTNWNALRVNKTLNAGTVIKTEGNETFDLFVNGISTVRVAKDNEVSINKLFRMGAGTDAVTTTGLWLTSGTVLGNVKKLTNASSYEIGSPQGIAHIRGAQYIITALQLPTAYFQDTFTCITGAMVVEATQSSSTHVMKIVRAGYAWTPCQQAEPVRMATQMIMYHVDEYPFGSYISPAPVRFPNPDEYFPPFRGNNNTPNGILH